MLCPFPVIARDLPIHGVKIQELWRDDLLPPGTPKTYPDAPAGLQLDAAPARRASRRSRS